ncbi:MAG: hypothetical protein CMC35_04485 [Flavobacteriaceae bacterium]|nr:hypothetical protein [Flavobacteriaceae bacterium]|tara:strand:- start:18064 stop:18438 length:375 start_codon:yes stop_codon:yes gene_type:complete
MKAPVKTYSTPFGVMQCFENYLVFSLKSPKITRVEAKQIISVAETHYRKKKYVFISNRTLPASISEEAYKDINPKYMVGIAIVSSDENVRKGAVSEQGWFDGAFSFFTSLEDATDWANTVVKRS